MRQSILKQCFGADKAKLLKHLSKALRSKAPSLEVLEGMVKSSIVNVQNRSNNALAPHYDQSLPFYDSKEAIRKAVLDNQVIVLCGETGSGKTTQIPQICFELGLGIKARIAHTQPRRLAARSVAQRIASESKTELGHQVGYKVRFSEQTSDNNVLVVMTDGMLLSEMNHDRFLNQYEVIIIDEAHERSLNIDLLLGLLKKLLTKRPDLKLIITSATIDTQRFADYFNGAPVLSVSGRTYPVDIVYRPLDEKNADLTLAVVKEVEFLNKKSPQDTLVFLPGERHIRDLTEKLTGHFRGKFDVLPLYGRLSFSDQQKIFKPSARAKIVLSTNVAETSLTVPGIRYVIDSGLVRMSRYSWRSKTQGLPIEKISQASANQRSGRCGRVAPGVAVRLYAEDDFEQRPQFTDPEILRTNLATVILQMALLNMGKIDDFDFLEAPDTRLIKDGYRLLKEIKAVDGYDKVTKIGRNIAQFPLDPSFSKMLMSASEHQCLHEILVIVSALSIQDPREVPQEHQQKARECHLQWRDDQSDFMSYLLLWQRIKSEQKQLSNNQFKKWCSKNFLAYMRLREWRDVYRQVKQTTEQLKLKMNDSDASSENIHRAILSGIPSHIATLQIDDKNKKGKTQKEVKRKFADYLATRNRALKIFPASGVKKPPKWLMAASFIDTRFLYAHEVAQCEPSWLMSDLQHLHQYEYSEPHFQPRYGRVSAYRNTKIYTLLIEARKRINFATIDPKLTREIFIRQGLVEAEYSSDIDFINKNHDLIEYYRQEEDKLRRRELLVDDDYLFDFYHKKLPEAIIDGPSLEKWAKQNNVDNMMLTQNDILLKQHEQAHDAYPESLLLKNQQLSLSYQFKPGTDADGVTVKIPLALLNQFHNDDFDYLVPGLLEEKIQCLIRSLPKKIRKNFVPVPDFAAACLDSLDTTKPLLSQLSAQLHRMTGVTVEAVDWLAENIEDHFKMRFCILKDNSCLETGRNLDIIQMALSGEATKQFEQQVVVENEQQMEVLYDWSCGAIESFIILKGTRIKAFPALVDYQDYVQLELLDTRQQADFYHPSGIARLIYFKLKPVVKSLLKDIASNSQLLLMTLSLGTKEDVQDDIIMSCINQVFLGGELPTDKESFEVLIASKKNHLVLNGNERITLVLKILSQWRALLARIEQESLGAEEAADISEQLAFLIYEGFIRDVPIVNLQRYPKYLLAIDKRLDKLKVAGNQLQSKLKEIRHYWALYLEKMDDDKINEALKSQYRWSIEEYRIACFAQPMKPALPVSSTKLNKMIEQF